MSKFAINDLVCLIHFNNETGLFENHYLHYVTGVLHTAEGDYLHLCPAANDEGSRNCRPYHEDEMWIAPAHMCVAVPANATDPGRAAIGTAEAHITILNTHLKIGC